MIKETIFDGAQVGFVFRWMVQMDTSEIEFGNCKTSCLGCHSGPIGWVIF
jgi:hypothetical protein